MAALLAATIGCSDDPKPLSLDVTVGHESDAMTQAPAITQVTVSAFDVEGALVAQSSTTPGGEFSLGEAGSDQLLRFEVEGLDGSGVDRLGGKSLSVVLGGITSDVLPIFAQRRRQWARPPGELPSSRYDGVSAVVGERFALLTGGVDADGDNGRLVLAYDLLALDGVTGGEFTDVTPTALVPSINGDAVLAVASDGKALWLDFEAGLTQNISPAAGWTFDEVSGGSTVAGPNGVSYLVGAGRRDQPSDLVLVIAPDRSITGVRLKHARIGAAAGYAEDRGLIVAGGSDVGPGVELLGPMTDAFVTLPYAPDPTEGANIAPGRLEGEVVLLGGAVQPPKSTFRLIDLDCVATCTEQNVPTGLPALTGARAFRLGETTLVVGATAPGEMESWQIGLNDGSAVRVPFKEPRKNGVIVASPLGSLLVLGGEHLDGTPALTVESFLP